MAATNDVANPSTQVRLDRTCEHDCCRRRRDSNKVSLNTKPTANVTVNFAEGTQINAIAPITFTPANSNAAQTVTVKATDDSIVEGTNTGLIFSSVAPGSERCRIPSTAMLATIRFWVAKTVILWWAVLATMC